VVPLNVAFPYEGYILNDIANELGVGSKWTIDFTKELPTSKGFKNIDFDNLKIEYSPLGEDLRGYELENLKVPTNILLEDIDELESFDGTIVYNVNPAHNRNPFTNKCNLFYLLLRQLLHRLMV
jgi:NADH-quinone oxidoreductase subunit G